MVNFQYVSFKTDFLKFLTDGAYVLGVIKNTNVIDQILCVPVIDSIISPAMTMITMMTMKVKEIILSNKENIQVINFKFFSQVQGVKDLGNIHSLVRLLMKKSKV